MDIYISFVDDSVSVFPSLTRATASVTSLQFLSFRSNHCSFFTDISTVVIFCAAVSASLFVVLCCFSLVLLFAVGVRGQRQSGERAGGGGRQVRGRDMHT